MGSPWQLVYEPSFGGPRCRLIRGDDIEQGGVQRAVRGENLPIVGAKCATAHVRHRASGLRHHDGPSGDVPCRDASFPVSIEPTSGDIAQVEGGGTCLPDRLNTHQEVTPDFGLSGTTLEVI